METEFKPIKINGRIFLRNGTALYRIITIAECIRFGWCPRCLGELDTDDRCPECFENWAAELE